ncbi:hypothetical protein G3I67_01685 [Orrella sp. NBD-18]|uniref:Glycine zipper 2TM domain-containing protein n=1 Tax=Sheuella amnicola TaxID=2707330 RepID=A0A6B2QUW6_9BURK|nr:hypothetical protein [Sheuella amnicola]NDY81931.1 hypothetical protein [Sheuella amnicola]HBI83654.1 hypothetical protein [Alcaligenaceae bacterium]
MNRKFCCSLLSVSVLALAGCATGQNYKPNVYRGGQVNQQQSAKTIQIIALSPVQVEVDNTKGQQAAMIGGAVLGAVIGGVLGNQSRNTGAGIALGGLAGGAGGSLVSNTVMVEGVSITYQDGTHTMNSVQVGRLCEYKQGAAVMISSAPGETRIQPNNEVPCPKE